MGPRGEAGWTAGTRAGPAAPSPQDERMADTTPTITVEQALVTASSIPVALTGTAGVTYRARVMTLAGVEEDEQGRVGSGAITLTPTSSGRKVVVAWPFNRTDGEPSNVVEVNVPSATVTPTVAWYRVTQLDRLTGSPYRRAAVERVERPIEP